VVTEVSDGSGHSRMVPEPPLTGSLFPRSRDVAVQGHFLDH
jgi:hypothetical protein